jgi:hypothetical protein
MKNSIGNGTRNPPACSAVPQPTAPPLASVTGLLAWILTHVLAKTKQRELVTRSIGTFIAFIIVAVAIPAIMFIFCMCFVRLFFDLCLFPAI